MKIIPYLPIYELTRGVTVESIHHGAIAVVDVAGRLIASYGNPDAVTFLRSTAKPFQALPFITRGGQNAFGLTLREVAILCSSHSGTDEHVEVVRGIQTKVGITEADLICGVHYPYHEPTANAMRERREQPTSNRHNCSGKHTGMLAYLRMRELAGEEGLHELDYIDPQHPIQQEILRTFSEMTRVEIGQIGLGTDGCSAPVFAVPLRNAALAFARLCDPEAGAVMPVERAAACHTITTAMCTHPDMVAGPGRYDTHLMEMGQGQILSKAGAEGYQGIGLMPGALGPGSPAIGIAFKIADGDARGKVRPAVATEILRQLGVLSSASLETLASFGPAFPVLNWRKIVVGQGYPVFELERLN
ncbi:MAG: asparaginase [Anaerolineales bacterium]|nr:asparaginase [Anaerolineales bacterium]